MFRRDCWQMCMLFGNLFYYVTSMKNRLVEALLLSFSLPVAAQDRPNIILFLVDDMGVMDTSLPFLSDSEGNAVRHPLNDWYKTPSMERLAQHGVRFSTFYAHSVSSPSRTSLMTGQDAARHHTTNWINSESNNRNQYGPYDWNWQGLKHSDVTLPRLLKEAGYKTIHVGKAHFGCIGSEGEYPQNIGFDVNIAGSSIGQPGSYLGENGYGSIHGNKSRAVPRLEKYHGTDTFLSEALTIEANAQIDKAIEEKKPFFLYMSHYAVHAPFEADKRFVAHYENGMGKSELAKNFATLIEGMDKSLGDIMGHLEKKGIARNTLVLFLGDNGSDAPLGDARGYASSAPLRGKKGTEFEGGMRVPCIIGWAHADTENKFQKELPVAEGSVQTQFGRITDIYPTLAALAKVDIPTSHPIDGADLKPLLSGKKDETRRNTFLMHFPHNHYGSYFTVYREDNWKLIYYYTPERPERPDYALYDLSTDEKEQDDLSRVNKGKCVEMIKKMISALESEGAQYPVDFVGREIRPVVPNMEHALE